MEESGWRPKKNCSGDASDIVETRVNLGENADAGQVRPYGLQM